MWWFDQDCFKLDLVVVVVVVVVRFHVDDSSISGFCCIVWCRCLLVVVVVVVVCFDTWKGMLLLILPIFDVVGLDSHDSKYFWAMVSLSLFIHPTIWVYHVLWSFLVCFARNICEFVDPGLIKLWVREFVYVSADECIHHYQNLRPMLVSLHTYSISL